MRRLSAAALTLMLFSGCWWWWGRPYVAPVGMPEGRAIEIANDFTRSRGYNPTGTSSARYNYHVGYWRVSLWLGPPSCGAARMNVNAFNGTVYDFVPYVQPCGGPPPTLPQERSDF